MSTYEQFEPAQPEKFYKDKDAVENAAIKVQKLVRGRKDRALAQKMRKQIEEEKLNEPIYYIFEEVSTSGDKLNLKNINKDSFSNSQKTFKMITPQISYVKRNNLKQNTADMLYAGVHKGIGGETKSGSSGIGGETKSGSSGISGGRKTRKRKHKRKSKKRKAKKKSRVKRKRKSRKKRVGGHDHGLHLGGGKFLLGGGI
jgi:hypothetical protein